MITGPAFRAKHPDGDSLQPVYADKFMNTLIVKIGTLIAIGEQERAAVYAEYLATTLQTGKFPWKFYNEVTTT